MKTFYSVKYSVWGADGQSEKWFDNKPEAEEFAKRDYTDSPVAHNCSKEETIAKYKQLVLDSHCEY